MPALAAAALSAKGEAAMFVIAIIIRSIALLAASALAAGLLCWLVYTFARKLHHPAWSALIILALFPSGLTRSEFVKLSAPGGLFGTLFCG
jgi:hypothetical protein